MLRHRHIDATLVHQVEQACAGVLHDFHAKGRRLLALLYNEMHLAPLWRAPVDAADIDGLALPNGGVDLIVLGMSADPDVGWHLLSKVRTTWAASRVLFLSDIVPLEVPLGGLSDGVVGCLSKFAPLADLEASFHLVARGHQVGVRGYRQVPPALPAGVPGNGIAASISTPALLHDGFDYEEAQILGLTPRQYEVLVLLARGHPLKVISRELNISVPTVKSHARALYKQLKVGGKGAAVYAARQQGARLGWVSSGGQAMQGTVLDRSGEDRNEPPRQA